MATLQNRPGGSPSGVCIHGDWPHSSYPCHLPLQEFSAMYFRRKKNHINQEIPHKSSVCFVASFAFNVKRNDNGHMGPGFIWVLYFSRGTAGPGSQILYVWGLRRPQRQGVSCACWKRKRGKERGRERRGKNKISEKCLLELLYSSQRLISIEVWYVN